MKENGIRLPEKTSECHKKVYFILSHANAIELSEIADSLNILRAIRNESDYDMESLDVETFVMAKEEVERAKEAIEKFDRYFQRESPRLESVNAMIEYSKDILKF